MVVDKHEVAQVFEVVSRSPESQVAHVLIVPVQVAQLVEHTSQVPAEES